jgi:hypothetical protein
MFALTRRQPIWSSISISKAACICGPAPPAEAIVRLYQLGVIDGNVTALKAYIAMTERADCQMCPRKRKRRSYPPSRYVGTMSYLPRA